MSPAEQKARTRFFIIGSVRLAGAIIVALSVAVSYGKISSIPNIAGYAMLVVGVVAMIIIPQVLIARWKTPPAQ